MDSDQTSQEPPPEWGKDDLTGFFDAARNNQWATFWNKKDDVRKLIDIDSQFVTVSRDWLNPQSEIAAFMLLRCHAAFRCAAGLAMAGQAPESYVQCRSMMEFAAYSVHVYKNPALGLVWLKRHNDQTAMQATRDAFSFRKVLASVEAANRDAGGRFAKLYQRAIDFGAHPNERSITGNMKMTTEQGRRNMLSIMLHDDGVALQSCLKNVCQCGLVSLEMLQVVFNARFELLGVNAAMLTLRGGL